MASSAAVASTSASSRKLLVFGLFAALLLLAVLAQAPRGASAEDEDEEAAEAEPMSNFVDFGNPEFQPQNEEHPRFDAACRVVTHALGRPIGGFVEGQLSSLLVRVTVAMREYHGAGSGVL